MTYGLVLRLIFFTACTSKPKMSPIGASIWLKLGYKCSYGQVNNCSDSLELDGKWKGIEGVSIKDRML